MFWNNMANNPNVCEAKCNCDDNIFSTRLIVLTGGASQLQNHRKCREFFNKSAGYLEAHFKIHTRMLPRKLNNKILIDLHSAGHKHKEKNK